MRPAGGAAVNLTVDVVGPSSPRLPPFALLHGSRDTIVPAESSCKLSALLGRLSVRASLYLLPSLNHMDVVTDLMSEERRYYHPIYSCIKLEFRKLNLLHP